MALTKSSLKKKWNEEEARYERAQEELGRVVQDAIDDLSADYQVRPVPFIGGDLKDFESFYLKACRYRDAGRATTAPECFKEIKDIARVRVICQTLDDAERIRRLLEDNDDLLVVREAEVHEGDERGYRGIHLEVEVDARVGAARLATSCEIQIQTALQFAWGLYTHKEIYKGAEVPDVVRELMIQLSDLLNVADRVAGTLIDEVEASAGAA